jgi:hypothetical protein
MAPAAWHDAGSAFAVQHQRCRIALGRSIRVGQHGIQDQPESVLLGA